MKGHKSTIFFSLFLFLGLTTFLFGWSWESADNMLPTLREDLDKEIAAYRQQVGNGMSIHERIIALDQLVNNYKPLGLSVIELETERSRLIIQEKQHELRSAEVQDNATELYEKGVGEFRSGQYQDALTTFREAERLLPLDESIKEIRRKLEGITSITAGEISPEKDGDLVRLSLTRFLENDPKRAMNAMVYAMEVNKARPELVRLLRLIETNNPETESLRLSPGINLIDHKLQQTLEAIYDGRYLTAIAECTDILDLEPDNVLALTRLGSAYYAMNEKDRARQIWTRALQIDPANNVLRKFLYGTKGSASAQKTP
jgi:tetratricopeptide (TPR) repeat protein